MKSHRWLWFAALLCAGAARDARAELPRVNQKLKTNQATIRKAVVLPVLVEYRKAGLHGVEGGAEDSDRIADELYGIVRAELAARGVEVAPNPLESARTEPERAAVAALQARYDTVAVQLRKQRRFVERGRLTLDDRVARFAPAAGSDTLVFVRGRGVRRVLVSSLATTSFDVEVSLVDARSGEVLAFLVYSSVRDVAKRPKKGLVTGLRRALTRVPLPVPPPKRS